MCNSNTIHIFPLISSTMDTNSQLIVEDTPLVGRNQNANVSLSPPPPPRKRSRPTLQVHITAGTSSELPYLPSLDRCHLPGSPTLHPINVQSSRIEYTTVQEVIDSSYSRTARRRLQEERAYHRLSLPRLGHDTICKPPRLRPRSTTTWFRP